jgi:hypothetical protein
VQVNLGKLLTGLGSGELLDQQNSVLGALGASSPKQILNPTLCL